MEPIEGHFGEELIATGGEGRTHLEVHGVVDRNGQSYWTRIGVAFRNRDGSWNIKLDYMPRNHEATIQLRKPREKDKATSA